jgi:hypothetical protein
MVSAAVPHCTARMTVLTMPPLTHSCNQLGQPLKALRNLRCEGRNTWPPLHRKTCSAMASTTASGAKTGVRVAFNASLKGPSSGVRTQLGWIDEVSTLGALYFCLSS